MKKISLRDLMIYETIFIFLLGSSMHFLYNLLPNPVFAAISPVTESVWEHLKLFILPTILIVIFEQKFIKNTNLIIWTKLVQFAIMGLFTIAFFYLYTGAFGISEILSVDILSFLVAIIIGQYFVYRIYNSKYKPKLQLKTTAIITAVVFVGLFVLSYKHPNIPLFMTHGGTSVEAR